MKAVSALYGAFMVLFCSTLAYSQDIKITLTVANVVPKGGLIYAAVYDSPEAFKQERSFRSLILEPESDKIQASLMLPPGDYVFSLFQDRNSNGKLDMGFLGIPKEPIGISNYDGRGIPGGFDSLKMKIDREGMVVEIRLKLLFR
jgi:uncharacterized protein (DUF2141 family)